MFDQLFDPVIKLTDRRLLMALLGFQNTASQHSPPIETDRLGPDSTMYKRGGAGGDLRGSDPRHTHVSSRPYIGAWRSPVARLNGVQEVRGSNPRAPTE